MFKHILLPTDGSELAERAVLAGIEFAQSSDARVTGLYVTSDTLELDPSDEARRILKFVEGTARDYGVPCEAIRASGHAVHEEIIRTAMQQGCDLIWMASRSKPVLGSLLLGSETNRVLVHSTIPVLVWR